MIESLEFKNFRVLKDATLPLGRVTVLLGPNGSGKSTVLMGLEALRKPIDFKCQQLLSLGNEVDKTSGFAFVELIARWGGTFDGETKIRWSIGRGVKIDGFGRNPTTEGATLFLDSIRSFSFDSDAIASPVELTGDLLPQRTGAGLGSTLTALQDLFPERFEAFNRELHRWFPEFDRVLLTTPKPGQRSFMLRLRNGVDRIPAPDLSQGTLVALAMLALTHLPEPPSILGLEEPDRGIHPRLLRDIQDAIYRLAYPENFGDDRKPVQVIMTTHSPYMVDLFRDHPEEIVICKKDGLYATFERLTDQAHIDEIIRGTSLGEAWYSGVLGGVPAES